MKIKVNKSIKIIISIVLVVCIGLLGVLALKESKNIGSTEEERVNYKYTYGTDVKYAVHLVPNILYEEEKLLEGETYITEFIKNITTNFMIDFSGDSETNITGEYEIVAQMAGYITQQEAKQDVWKKEFVLAGKQAFTGQDSYSLEKAVAIDFHTYNELSKAIIEASKVSLPVELRIILSGNLVATNTYGTVNKPIKVSLVLPLGSNYFTIAKAGVGETRDTIKETITIPLPANKKVITLYIGGIAVMILALASLMLFTTPPTKLDLERKEINKILTAHGSRMVGVDEMPETNYKENYEVGHIEDLVKIADELEKPLIYKYSKEPLDINKFYVVDNDVRYSCQINKKPIEEELVVNASQENILLK